MRVFLILAGLSITPAPTPADAPESPSSPRSVGAEPELEPAPEYQNRLAAALAPEPGGLTADKAARRAVKTAPSVERRRAELQNAAAFEEETIGRFAPDLTATATYTRISPANVDFGGAGASVGALNEGPLGVSPCPGGSGSCVVDSGGVPVQALAMEPIEVPVNNYSLQAMVTVPFLDYALKLLPARRGSDANTTAAVYQRDAEQVRVELDARLAYYDWLRARAQVAVAEQTVGRTRLRLQDAQVGEAAGTLTQVDVTRLDGLLANAESKLQGARSIEALAAQRLAIMMADSDYHYRVGDDVLTPPGGLEGNPSRAALVEEARRERLEIKALDAASASYVEAGKAARASFWPRIDGHAEVTYANPNQRYFPLSNRWQTSWSAGVIATWRLSTFLTARAQNKQANATRRTVEADLAAMERAVEMEVHAAWEERERARVTVDLTRRWREAAVAAYEQQVTLYRGGEATTTDIIESEVERVNATLQDVNARIDLHTAHAKLTRASGRMRPLGIGNVGDDKYVPPRLRKKGLNG